MPFRRVGARAQFALWAAVASHFLLDVPIHPAPLQLWPHAPFHAPWDLWLWGKQASALGMKNYGLVQGAVTAALLAAYAVGANRRRAPANLIAASCVAVAGIFMLV